jgi:type VI secretion system protein ImpF
MPMADLMSAERLQPSLLDRLTDAVPGQQDFQAQRVLTQQKLRDCVRRDLGILLNTINLAAVVDLSAYPDAARSTLNYGIPDLAGVSGASIDGVALEKAIRQAILDFEPRLLARSVKVAAVVRRNDMSRNALTFHIDAEMWARPSPLAMYLKTVVDLEAGGVSVTERLR